MKVLLARCQELDKGIFQVPSNFYFSSFIKFGKGKGKV